MDRRHEKGLVCVLVHEVVVGARRRVGAGGVIGAAQRRRHVHAVLDALAYDGSQPLG